jgi:NAD(P)-dependent dehydrogenase (short-subunit alcohol dehydrogenase family)
MRKQAIGTATIPAVGGAGKFASLVAPALAKRGVKIRGLAPNAKQGGIVRKHGAAEISIGDLRDRASLDAALKDVDAVFYIAPAFLPNEAVIGKSMVDAARRAGVRRRAVLPLMKGRGWGRIVNFGSASLFEGVPGHAHYVAAKAGVAGFTRSIARELGEYGITVNVLTPGLTLTPSTKKIFPSELLEGQRRERAHPTRLSSRRSCRNNFLTPDHHSSKRINQDD